MREVSFQFRAIDFDNPQRPFHFGRPAPHKRLRLRVVARREVGLFQIRPDPIPGATPGVVLSLLPAVAVLAVVDRTAVGAVVTRFRKPADRAGFHHARQRQGLANPPH